MVDGEIYWTEGSSSTPGVFNADAVIYQPGSFNFWRIFALFTNPGGLAFGLSLQYSVGDHSFEKLCVK